MLRTVSKIALEVENMLKFAKMSRSWENGLFLIAKLIVFHQIAIKIKSMLYYSIMRYLKTLLITLICVTNLLSNEAEDAFKNIIIKNDVGNVTGVNAANILSVESANGYNDKKRIELTLVLEADREGNITKTYSQTRPNEIVKLANDVNVRFEEVHKGSYFNPRYFADVHAFVTSRSILYMNEMTISDANRLRNMFVDDIKNRTGMIILKDYTSIKVSKRKVPKVRNHLIFKGFTKDWWSRFLSINSVVLLYTCTDLIDESGNRTHIGNVSMPLYRLAFNQRLINEYNRIQCLEGELVLDYQQVESLVHDYGFIRNPFRQFDPIGIIHWDPKSQSPNIWQLSPLKRSIIGLLYDLNAFSEPLNNSTAVNVFDAETPRKLDNKLLIILLVILVILPPIRFIVLHFRSQNV